MPTKTFIKEEFIRVKILEQAKYIMVGKTKVFLDEYKLLYTHKKWTNIENTT